MNDGADGLRNDNPPRGPVAGRAVLAANRMSNPISEMARWSLSPDFLLRVPIVTIVLADVLPVAFVVPVQSIHHKGVCPYTAHLFVDVLAKVGYVKNATSIIQVRINHVFPEAFEQR
jgi:hypothetical protein